MAAFSIFYVFIGLLALYLLKTLLQPKQNHPPLPPGPKGQPLIGNLNDLPKPGELESLHWLKHKDIYGLFASDSIDLVLSWSLTKEITCYFFNRSN